MAIYPTSALGYVDYDLLHPQLTYILSTPAAALPVSLVEVKTQARINTSITTEDTYLGTLINAATTSGELYTRRDFINKGYTAYLDYFPPDNCGIEIQKSKLQSVTSIEYLVDGVWTTLSSSLWYITQDPDFASIYLNNGEVWPQNVDVRKQAIRIVFTAGYGTAGTDVPQELRTALLQHITFMYQSRGDAMDGGFNASMPQLAIDLYYQFKILNI